MDEPGKKSKNVSYSFQEEDTNLSKIKVKSANAELIHNVKPTGKTIGEPNQKWIIDNFKSYKFGLIKFPEPGFYTITVNI